MYVRLLVVLSLLLGIEAAANCGQKQSITQGLIANGFRAMAGSRPWHGAMFYKKKLSMMYTCGVTVLTEWYVLTAAHCKIYPDNYQVLVKLGLTNLDITDWYVQEHWVDKIIPHEDYDKTVFENDIALMKLLTKITYSSYVQPICLWQGDPSQSRIVGKLGYVVGWGQDEEYKLPSDLNEATAPIVSRQQCVNSDVAHYRRYLASKTLCAGYRNGTLIGSGDSGGGLFLRRGNHWFLRGIVSNSKMNPDTKKFDTESFNVYTDAAYFIDWINTHAKISTSVIIEEPPPSSSDATQSNLLGLKTCGRDKYAQETPEELKKALDQYPWLAVIEYIDKNTGAQMDGCHGVLIHPSFTLTTAHCVLRKQPYTIKSIRLNDYYLNTVTDIFVTDGSTIRTTTVRIAVTAAVVHPNFDSPKFANNIALLMLGSATTMTPICLPPIGFPLSTTGKQFSIIGWKRNGRREKPLIRNVVYVVDFETCRRKYSSANIMLDSTGGQLCSTYNHNDEDGSCSHYMGSAPFQYVMNGPTEGRYYLAAFSSFGHTNCQRDEYSDVFTNVGHYGAWIKEKVIAYQYRNQRRT